MAISSHAQRNTALDGLRACAIVLVFFTHAVPVSAVSPSWLVHLVSFGERGVDLFFVLSGYLIGSIAMREFYATGKITLRAFWRKRWFRTLPAYYAAFTLYALKGFLPHRSEGLISPVSYLFFAQTYVVGHLADFAHSWSLCVEEHFYLLLPLLLNLWGLCGERHRKKFGWALAAVGLFMVVLRMILNGRGVEVYEKISHWRTDGLVVGVLLASIEQGWPAAWQWLERQRPGVTLVALLLSVCAVYLHFADSDYWQPVVALACGALVILGVQRQASMARFGGLRPVAWMALVSYSFYLLHPLVLGALTMVFFKSRMNAPAFVLIYICLGFMLSALASQLLYLSIEKPFLRLRDSFRQKNVLVQRA